MGNNQNKLNDAIFYNLHDQVEQILHASPELVNQYLDVNKTSFPLLKVVSLKRDKMISLLLSKDNIDINKKSSSGETAITRACKFGYINVLELLDSNNCDFLIEDNDGRNALDYAIIYGKYNCAQYIYKKGVEIKEDSFYIKNKKNFGTVEVNIERFREMLQSGVQIDPKDEHKMIMMKKKKVEMVFDPQETYTEMFKSLINFSEPKMIPRDQIKDPKLLPENRSLRSLRQVFNWRGTNYLETTKKKDDDLEVKKDGDDLVEMESLPVDQLNVNDIENQKLKEDDIKEFKSI